MMDYYLATVDGKRAGPYSLDQVRAFWASGRLTRATPYWTHGLSSWRPISDLESLLKGAQQASLQSLPPLPVATADKRKSLGCTRALGSCMAIAAIGFGALVILGLISSLITGKMPQVNEGSGDGLYKSGYLVGYDYGVLYEGVQKGHGLSKDSPDQIEAAGRAAVRTLGKSDADPRTNAVVFGYKDGYNDAWADFLKATAKAERLHREEHPLPHDWPPKEVELTGEVKDGHSDAFALISLDALRSFGQDSDTQVATVAAQQKALPDPFSAEAEKQGSQQLKVDEDTLESKYLQDGRAVLLPPGRYPITGFYDFNGNRVGLEAVQPENPLVVEISVNNSRFYAWYPMRKEN
jgi:hypothetical protein